MATFMPNNLEEASALAAHRTIPFDYAFRYELQGIRDNVLNSTVTVSIEATFVAVSIGYGVIPRVSPVKIPATLPSGLAVRATSGTLLEAMPFVAGLAATLNEPITGKDGQIGHDTAAALVTGIRLTPELAQFALTSGVNVPLKQSVLEGLLGVVATPREILFKYAIFDEGTGREFQSEPILNTAGLGISDGERPFRYFARPIRFLPRSVIRMQVTEVSDFPGTLHVSLQGYKVLGGAGTPTGRIGRRFRNVARR